jgi:PIN domain nuclease of toxin-antitoxin system
LRLLLDTHTFLWLNLEPEKCSTAFIRFCENIENTLYLSHASIWEIQIKHQLNKLSLQVPLREMVESNQAENNLQLLSIEPSHIYALAMLPNHHRDPFDRLLIAQAIQESMTLVTIDHNISLYPVEIMQP